jgi:hypothetical protein
MITENKINDIIDYKIRVNKNFVPRSANKLLPPFFYSALFIGATGTGKTFKLVELLKLYEKYDILDSDWLHLGTLGTRGGERAATTLPCRFEWRSSCFGATAGRSVGSERRRRRSADWAFIVCVWCLQSKYSVT